MLNVTDRPVDNVFWAVEGLGETNCPVTAVREKNVKMTIKRM